MDRVIDDFGRDAGGNPERRILGTALAGILLWQGRRIMISTRTSTLSPERIERLPQECKTSLRPLDV
jgi:hypothetical protein